MKVLVTGANGFLGSWLVERLLLEGFSVSVLLRPTSDYSHLKPLNIKIIHGDITNFESIKGALQEVDCVYHLAGYVGYSKKEYPIMKAVNTLGTENVVNAILQVNPKIKLLHLSSVVTIGAGLKPTEVLNEDSKYNLSKFNFGYFETKRSAEDYVLKAVKERSLNAVIVNPSTIYGARDAQKGSRSTQLKVAQGKMLFYPPGGVSVVAVEDVVDGIVQAVKYGRVGERYILSGDNLYLKDVFNLIAKCAKVNPPQFPMPGFILNALANLDDLLKLINCHGPMDSERLRVSCMYHWFDHSKATKELNFKPRPAEEAINNSVCWALNYKKN